MQLSIRNRYDAIVESVVAGSAMTVVRMRLGTGIDITAAITSDAATDLDLGPGSTVQILIKSTEVSLALDAVGRVSIRNLIPATVRSVDHGTAMTVVKMDLAEGSTLTSAITAESAEDLGLTPGMTVTAMVKSTDVSIAVA
jgi:molybdate transport system regulatory protein